jgi:hypothetical protein
LLAVPSIAEDDTRRILVEQLRPDIAGAVPYHRRPRQHVIGIVRTCLNYDGGLADLVGVIEQIEGDSLPVRDLKRTMAKLRPWLTE